MKNSLNRPLVSIISVNFNQLSCTLAFLESIFKINYGPFEIIVVDNGSTIDPEKEIKTKYPGTKVIKNNRNLGFAAGNNSGIAVAKGKYLLFLNNDTIVDPDFLQPLVDLFENNSSIGACSPKIKYFDRDNTIQWGGSSGISEFTIRGFARGGQELDLGQCDDTIETELVHGSAMMVPREVILDVGLMPDLYFLYYEEHDWIERIKAKGYKIYFVGNSTVYHKESMSIGKKSPIKTYYLHRGRLIFTRRNRKGWKRTISLISFGILSFPKAVLAFSLKGEFDHLKAFWSACLWNLKNSNVSAQPQLVANGDGSYSIKNATRQEIKIFT
ncbi:MULTISPECIES: glycosyltransferase family 2 protein [Rhodonellum]|uniref:Glycosyltransferase 2-like domain-containing protein n=1 Tax=Rhodonellum ikkaensis TaxID=336829 RepID=A0A1H3S4E2_9BACT|nr:MULTISPECIES: glycosyltransferase family 2 protein [Rhodonellum]SDZ32690.1 hypothetical protein SAMN05444412_11092 [Rhodonellum ikkaensis]